MAGNDDTVKLEFYAPWPAYGKALNKQWGAIRTDTAHLAPLVRGAGLDADGDFSTLDDVEQAALQAWALGEDGYHNKIRHYWNKDKAQIEIQANIPPGTSGTPNWYPVWAVGDDGQVTQQTTPTTASNVGTGSEVFKQKTGVDLQFRTVKATGVLSVAENNLDLTLTSTAEANTARSDGGVGDYSLVKTKDGVVLPFRGLTAGDNMELTLGADSITLKSTSQIVEFYGIVVSHSDDSYVNASTHVLKFNVEHFYVKGSGSEPGGGDEATVNLRGEIFNSREYVAVAGDTMTGALLHPDGSAAAPASSYADDTDTGVTRLASDDLALVSGGTSVLRALTDRVYLPKNLQIMADGTAAAPDVFWFSNSTTGLFQKSPGDDSIAFATAGVEAGYFDADQSLWVTSGIFVAEDTNAYSRFGGAPVNTTVNTTDTLDMLVSHKEQTNTGGLRRAGFFIMEVNTGASNSTNGQNYGLNAAVYTVESMSGDNSKVSQSGGAAGGIYAFRHRGSGEIYKAGGATGQVQIQGLDDGTIRDGYGFLDVGADGGAGVGGITNYHGLWIQASTGNVTNKNGIFIEDLTNADNAVGILSEINEDADGSRLFINHTGTAPSVHTGEFYVGDDLHLEDAFIRNLGGITFRDASGTIAGIQNQNLLDKTALATISGTWSFDTTSPTVPEEVYGVSWDGSSQVPTKNALYDKIETLGGGFYALTVRESGPGRVLQSDTVTFDTAGFYVSVGGDGKPLISPQGTIIRTDTHNGIANLLKLNDGGLSAGQSIGMECGSDGTTVLFYLTNTTPGANKHDPVNFQFHGEDHALDISGDSGIVTVTPGSATSPVESFIHVELTADVAALSTSTSDWPQDVVGTHDAHARIATVVVQDAATVKDDGALKIHAWTDHVSEVHEAGSGERGERGHLHALAERLRAEPAVWRTGVALNPTTLTNSGTTDPLYVITTAGTGYQLHRHDIPAQDTSSTDWMWVVNDDTTPYTKIDSVNDLTRYATGGEGEIGINAYFTIVLWMVVSENTQDSNFFINVPTGGYSTLSAAQTDASGKTVYNIPNAYAGTSILLYELVLSRSGGGTTWTHHSTTDLRGVPGVAVGGGGATLGGEVNTASNLSPGIGLFAQKTSIDLEFKSLISKGASIALASNANSVSIDATGSFYTPVTVEGADAKVTVGSGETGADSITSYYKDGTLAWTMGIDNNKNEFILTSGAMDDTVNEIRLTPNKIGFFNATPIVQQTTSSQTEATYAAVGGTNVDSNDTWDGYTVGDLVAILRAYGLLT